MTEEKYQNGDIYWNTYSGKLKWFDKDGNEVKFPTKDTNYDVRMTEEIINADGSRNWEANILLDNIRRLEQENKELKTKVKSRENELANMAEQANMRINTYRSALGEIRVIAKFNQFYNPEDLLINGDIGQIQNLKMTEIYNRINEVLE